jgi:hypothetical protein
MCHHAPGIPEEQTPVYSQPALSVRLYEEVGVRAPDGVPAEFPFQTSESKRNLIHRPPAPALPGWATKTGCPSLAEQAPEAGSSSAPQHPAKASERGLRRYCPASAPPQPFQGPFLYATPSTSTWRSCSQSHPPNVLYPSCKRVLFPTYRSSLLQDQLLVCTHIPSPFRISSSKSSASPYPTNHTFQNHLFCFTVLEVLLKALYLLAIPQPQITSFCLIGLVALSSCLG